MANLKSLDASEIKEGLECYYQSNSHDPIKGTVVFGNFQMIGGGYYFNVESQSELGCIKINQQ